MGGTEPNQESDNKLEWYQSGRSGNASPQNDQLSCPSVAEASQQACRK